MGTAGWVSSRRPIYMCGSSSASQKRRNGHNARLKTTSCGRHDVRGRWRRSVDDPHPKPLRPVPPAQSRAFCYAQTDRPYREGPSTCAVCLQQVRNAETAATRVSNAQLRQAAHGCMMISAEDGVAVAFEACVAAVSAFLACWRQTAHVDGPSRHGLSACA